MPDTSTEEKVEESSPDTKADDTKEVLKEIRDHLKPKEEKAPQLSHAELRERIKLETGLTDKQLDFHENSLRTATTMATAPLKERLAWTDLKEKVGRIEPDIEKLMKEELSQYPQEKRGDDVLLEKIYYLSVGKVYGKKSTSSEPDEERGAPAENGSGAEVIRRRVMSEHPGASPSLSNSGSPSKLKLSDEERKMKDRYKMSDEEWAKHKSTNVVQDLKPKK